MKETFIGNKTVWFNLDGSWVSMRRGAREVAATIRRHLTLGEIGDYLD